VSEQPSKPIGRPSSHTPEIADEICLRLAEGESLRAICRDDHMPSRETVRKWLRDETIDRFIGQYAQAREDQAESLADQVLEIAMATTPETVVADRLRVDALKWLAGKLKPKVYGNLQRIEQTGADGGPILEVVKLVHKYDVPEESKPVESAASDDDIAALSTFRLAIATA